MESTTGSNLKPLSLMFALLLTAVTATAVPQAAQSLQGGSGGAGAGDAGVADSAARREIPFGTGEKMDYQLKYGVFGNVGKGWIEVKGVEDMRGRPAWRAEMHVEGRALFYSLKATYTTWFDTATHYSLRYTRDQLERGIERDRIFDIYPDRAVFRQRITPDTLPEMPSVSDPLDETSFLYFLRTAPLEVGKTYTYPRYFRPDRNPVVIRVVRKETVSIPLGSFPAIVVQPTIKAGGVFGDDGEALVWLSDDNVRLILKIESKAAFLGKLQLNLTGYSPAKVRGR
jgi:hypothetical protein